MNVSNVSTTNTKCNYNSFIHKINKFSCNIYYSGKSYFKIHFADDAEQEAAIQNLLSNTEFAVISGPSGKSSIFNKKFVLKKSNLHNIKIF